MCVDIFSFFFVCDFFFFFFFQAEDGIRDDLVTGVQTCALPISTTINHWAPVIDRCRLCDEQARVKFDYVSKYNSNSLVYIPIGRVEKYPTMH